MLPEISLPESPDIENVYNDAKQLIEEVLQEQEADLDEGLHPWELILPALLSCYQSSGSNRPLESLPVYYRSLAEDIQEDSLKRSPPAQLFSWLEWTLYENSGNLNRIKTVFPLLSSLNELYRSKYSKGAGSRANSSNRWLIPFNREDFYFSVGDTALSALDSQYLSQIGLELEDHQTAMRFAEQYLEIKEFIEEKMWDEFNNIYTDITEDEFWTNVRQMEGLFPFFADIAPRAKSSHLKLLLSSNQPPSGVIFGKILADKGVLHEDSAYTTRLLREAPMVLMSVIALENMGEFEEAMSLAHNYLQLLSDIPASMLNEEEVNPTVLQTCSAVIIILVLDYEIGLRCRPLVDTIEWICFSDQKLSVSAMPYMEHRIDASFEPLKGDESKLSLSSSLKDIDLKLFLPSGNHQFQLSKLENFEKIIRSSSLRQ